ncbi:hypothetical protein EKO23_14380 [Nocardioides guangzhouensis]|uniref:YfhO family protein n=1 Tax=Nocardioides guangzhouensis TaxID=2497878 RepID=A0A4Q4ZCP5_9ACTN|nr:hypothetical protein [Nocardioides guangzhouensis]RYP84944.1 hypothetical protein EKO23_14380 [Nocardioides guangzhouensis]
MSRPLPNEPAPAADRFGWLPLAWAALLTLVLLGPALGRGYVLSYDMVWVPDLALRSDFLGLSPALPRAVPSDAVVAVLDAGGTGMLLQKLVLLGTPLLAAAGAVRLVGASTVARMVAVTVTVWNPFVVERLWIGHWPVLLGYAVVPWLVVLGRRVRDAAGVPLALWFLLPLGCLSASAGLVSAAALLVSAAGAPARRWAGLAALCLAANAPWLVAGATHAGDARTGTGSSVFGLGPDGAVPAPLAALGLGGIWNAEVVPGSRDGAAGWLWGAVVVLLAALGARAWWRRERRADAVGVAVLWLAGYGLAVLTWAAPGATSWLGENLPGGGLLRDGARSLALCLPLLVSLVASGAEVVVARAGGRVAAVALAVACTLVPVALLTDAAWGIGGALRPAHYPAEYAAARSAVVAAAAGRDGDLLVLPFTSYRAPDWNGHRKVLDPLGRYLTPNYLASDDLAVSGDVIPGEDPRASSVRAALRLPSATDRAEALGRLGVRWVAREADAPAADNPVYDAAVAGRTIHDGQRLEVVEIRSPVAVRDQSRTELVATALAWTAFAALPLVGAVTLVTRRARRMVTGEETTATVRR